ncbi:hypothetical protein C3L33_07897, partial [Rhododendron williamsianum]
MAAVPGTPESLEYVRNLTDVGSITRLLHEYVSYQRTLDLNLDATLSHRIDLNNHLSDLHKSSADVLPVIKSDSDHTLSNLRSTSDLADQVTRNVRTLDLAQSRVSHTLFLIDAIVGRANCLDGVVKALDSEDFESAANCVHTFLQIDAKYEDSGSDKREKLLAYKNQLERIVRKRLSVAVDQLDHPSILRFISLFKDIVLAVDENDEILRSLCGEDAIVYAICELQEECDSRGSLVLKKYLDYRKLAKLTAEVKCYKSNLLSVGVEGPDPREIELYVEEILSLTQLGEDYMEHMVSKIRGLSSVDPELGLRAMKAFRSGNFSKVAQEISGYYAILEGFFMVENVRKAINIDEHVPDSLTTSMVDDVFYVLQSCCRRSVSTSNINSAIAVLGSAVSLLGSEYIDALQHKMRESNLGAKLFLGSVGMPKTGTEVATALNNMDISSEYALKLRQKIDEQCAELFVAPADVERVNSCLSELGEMSNSFKKALNVGMEQLVATVTGRIRPVLDSVATISYELSEAEYADNEVNDPWVQRLLHSVESNVAWFQPLMTANNYDPFIHFVIDFIVKRLEVIMMQKRFSQLGGLQLDRDTRALVSHFSSMTQRTVRDKFARLTQMATILNLEKVSEILDFWGENSGPMTWRLTPAEVRRMLGLRVDFKPEPIAALKL